MSPQRISPGPSRSTGCCSRARQRSAGWIFARPAWPVRRPGRGRRRRRRPRPGRTPRPSPSWAAPPNPPGRAAVDGKTLAELRRRSIWYVFQELNLLATLTAGENVALPLELDGARPRTAAAQARALLAELGMAELTGRFPEELSGGEQQRVAIARAVVGERRLLLADEPTGALDSFTGETVLELLRRQCDNGCAAVLVTHDARYAAWADRVVFLRDGRLVDQTAPADDLHGPRDPEAVT